MLLCSFQDKLRPDTWQNRNLEMISPKEADVRLILWHYQIHPEHPWQKFCLSSLKTTFISKDILLKIFSITFYCDQLYCAFEIEKYVNWFLFVSCLGPTLRFPRDWKCHSGGNANWKNIQKPSFKLDSTQKKVIGGRGRRLGTSWQV